MKVMLEQEERSLTTGLSFKTRGSIVNVGSICSHKSLIPGMSPYVMAKHGKPPSVVVVNREGVLKVL